jgi:uncharacterized membrane protein
MPVVDILSAYLICGVSSLVGALLMRMARSDEPRMRAALRTFVGAFGVLGVGLLPAGLGPLAAHPAAPWSMTACSVAGVVLLAHAIGHLEGHWMPRRRVGALLLVCAVDPATVRRIAERLRLTLAEADWAALHVAQPVTVSIGVAVVGPGERLDDTLQRADEALYRAKREGRNQCRFSLKAA